MKAVTINISLNPELAEFARSDSEANAFDSMSEYMRDLIRHRRQQRVREDVALLEKAMEGPAPPSAECGMFRRFVFSGADKSELFRAAPLRKQKWCRGGLARL